MKTKGGTPALPPTALELPCLRLTCKSWTRNQVGSTKNQFELFGIRTNNEMHLKDVLGTKDEPTNIFTIGIVAAIGAVVVISVITFMCIHFRQKIKR